MIREGVALGEIPADLGETALAEVQARGKMTPDIYRRLADGLAARGLSHVAITPLDRDPPPITAKYTYLPRNPFFWLLKVFIQFVLIFFGFVLGQVWFGIRVVGRKNLRGVKRAVTVSNHIAYLDPLLIKRVAAFRRLKITAAPGNVGRGPVRPIMKAAGVMPFGSDLAAMRNFNKALVKVAKKGFVHFYAEQSMWGNYPPPRPLKQGAFLYAVKFNAPVVPIFYAYRKPGRLRKLLHLHAPITVVIGQPIRPDVSLGVKPAADRMRDEAETFMKQAYEQYAELS